MSKRHYQVFVLLIVAVLAGVTALHAQLPPPPPPPEEPPCWPPPCIPVDGGLIFAIGAAAAFGGKKLYNSFKSNKGEK